MKSGRVQAVCHEAILFSAEESQKISTPFAIVDPWIWHIELPQADCDFWETGYFRVLVPKTYGGYDYQGDIEFFHVCFWPDALPGGVDNLLSSAETKAEKASLPAPANPEARTWRGRKPAAWWPAFAEELAIHIHENGIPEGTGSDGQGEIINALLQRLADRGHDASRTTIQPVIQSVIARLRAAGK